MKVYTYALCILILSIHSAQAMQLTSDSLVDIGSCVMHINCSGKSQGPTVILDACLGGNSCYWSLVQPEVARFARVCSFDRVGLGLSSDNGLERTSEHMAYELHTLLQKSGINGPYILVGHSSGGINMRLYANTYPEEVYGVILVDASHEDQLERFDEINQKFPVDDEFVWPPLVFPEVVQESLSRFNISSKPEGGKREWECFSESMQQLKLSKNKLIEKPLIVITALQKREDRVDRPSYKARMRAYDSAWLDFQKDFLKLSHKSMQIFAPKSGHFVLFDQPEIIVDAVQRLVNQYNQEKTR